MIFHIALKLFLRITIISCFKMLHKSYMLQERYVRHGLLLAVYEL